MFKKETLKVLLVILIPYIAIITAGATLLITIQYNHRINLIKKNELLQLDLVKKSVQRDLENILPDIEVLVNERHVQRFIYRQDETSRKLVEQELASFSRNKRIYRQIRLLDIKGNENVRINYINKKIKIIDKKNLQNKKDRYYFMNTINLGRGELYISPLDLNIENEKIEKPHVPTIRFAIAVYDNQDTIRGIIVLNYNANYMLKHFDEMLAGSYGHIALLNQESYWLRSHKHEREWAFMFNKNIKFSLKHPDEWKYINTHDMGQIKSADGLFTFTSVFPLQLIGGYSQNEVENNHKSHHHHDPKSYVWKIISDVPAKKFEQILHEKIFGIIGIIWITLFIVGAIASWYLSLIYWERKKLRYQNELHAKIYNTSTDGIIITDKKDKIIDINAAFTKICGYSRDEIIGNTPCMFSSGRHDQEFYNSLWETLDDKGYWEGEICNRHKSGSLYTEWIRISAIKNNRGDISNYIALVSDITHKKTTEEQLLKYAHHDPLTGVHNRLSFEERFEQNLLLAKRSHSLLALLYLDLDKFKPINDTYGHQVGDMILQTVTERIEKQIRETDTLARLGGDEFVIVLTQIEKTTSADQIADTLRHIILQPIIIEGLELSVDVSIGVALYPRDGSDKDELIEKADTDMFKNKKKHI